MGVIQAQIAFSLNLCSIHPFTCAYPEHKPGYIVSIESNVYKRRETTTYFPGAFLGEFLVLLLQILHTVWVCQWPGSRLSYQFKPHSLTHNSIKN